MVLFIVYHVIVLVWPGLPGFAVLFKSVLFTGVTVFIWTLVWSQRQLQSPPGRGASR